MPTTKLIDSNSYKYMGCDGGVGDYLLLMGKMDHVKFFPATIFICEKKTFYCA